MLKLPEEMRVELAKPYGKLYRGVRVDLKKIEEIKGCRMLACVGDLVSAGAVEATLDPEIVVVDGKTLRHERVDLNVFEDFTKIYADNPAGHISCDLVKAIITAVEKAVKGERVCIWVKGEEDLAVMPLGLIMPEGSLVLYGQPGEGVVALKIDREKKVLILSLMRRMERVGDCEEIDRLIGGDEFGSLR